MNKDMMSRRRFLENMVKGVAAAAAFSAMPSVFAKEPTLKEKYDALSSQARSLERFGDLISTLDFGWKWAERAHWVILGDNKKTTKELFYFADQVKSAKSRDSEEYDHELRSTAKNLEDAVTAFSKRKTQENCTVLEKALTVRTEFIKKKREKVFQCLLVVEQYNPMVTEIATRRLGEVKAGTWQPRTPDHKISFADRMRRAKEHYEYFLSGNYTERLNAALNSKIFADLREKTPAGQLVARADIPARQEAVKGQKMKQNR